MTSKNQLAAYAPEPTPRAVLDKLAAMQMFDAWLPTTDGRFLVLPRNAEPDQEGALLRQVLNLQLPPQPPPRLRAMADSAAPAPWQT